MKATESKSTHSQQHNATDHAAIDSNRDRGLFSAPSTAFFQPTTATDLQFKPMSPEGTFFQPSASSTIQAKCASCAEEDALPHQEPPTAPLIQRMPAFESETVSPASQPQMDDAPESFPVQPRLTIAQSNDPYEREADAMADRVVAMPQGSSALPTLLASPITPLTQRKQAGDVQSDGMIPQLQSAQGRGEELDDATRLPMEAAFGQPLSAVRIHTDSEAIQFSQALGAQAFTHGSDIYFNAGKYNPATQTGKHLLAHELTHVIQQQGVTPAQPLSQPLQASLIQTNLLDSIPGVETVERVFNSIRSRLQSLLQGVIQHLLAAIGRVRSQILALIQHLLAFQQRILTLLRSFIEYLHQRLRQLIDAICDHICDYLLPILAGLTALAEQAMSLYQTLSQWFADQYAQLTGMLSTLGNWIEGIYQDIRAQIQGLYSSFIALIRSSIPGGAWIAGVITALVNQAIGWITRLIQWAITQVNQLRAALATWLNQQFSHGGRLLRSVWAIVRAHLPTSLQRVLRVLSDLRKVKWERAFETRGLRGNWSRLFFAWFCETSPPDLGVWVNDRGTATVIIRPGNGFTDDLRNKPFQIEFLAHFRQGHQQCDRVRVGDQEQRSFSFTGHGTTTDDYDMVEWFLGSYRTTIRVLSLDRRTRRVNLQVEVYNLSHWTSGTRVPPSWIRMGFPPYLIPDMKRAVCGPGGDLAQRFIWQETFACVGASTLTQSGCFFSHEIPGERGVSVFFDVGKADLSSQAQQDIRSFAQRWQTSRSDHPIAIDGYASVEGSDALNAELSCKRATRVQQALNQEGIPQDKTEAIAHGETQAFSVTRLEQNRRTTISER